MSTPKPDDDEAGERTFALGQDERAQQFLEDKKASALASPEATRAGILGRCAPLATPLGAKPLVYADWTASARALAPVEAFIRGRVLPLYGNTHTAASACGAQSEPARKTRC